MVVVRVMLQELHIMQMQVLRYMHNGFLHVNGLLLMLVKKLILDIHVNLLVLMVHVGMLINHLLILLVIMQMVVVELQVVKLRRMVLI